MIHEQGPSTGSRRGVDRLLVRRAWLGHRGDLAFDGLVALVYVGAAVLALQMTHPVPNRMMVLAERLVRGHLDSPTFAGTVDSVEIGGRYYVAVGVLQLVPYIPFVALPALQRLSGFLASLAFGVPAAWLALPLARAYGAHGRTATWIGWFTAFGTLLFFVSVLGSMYYLAQAEAFLFLELVLLEWVGARRPTVLGVLFGLAFLARPTTVLAAIPFGVVLVWRGRDRLRSALALGAPIVMALAIYGAFDWARFGSPLETGYAISRLANPLLEARRSLGLFSLAQVPENLRLALLQGFGMQAQFPYLTIDQSGLSMLLVSPALLAALWAGVRSPRARLLWTAALIVAVPVFLYYGGGYAQYGFRYSLDFTPFLIALLAMGSDRWLGWPEKALIVVSSASVTFGVLWAAHAIP